MLPKVTLSFLLLWSAVVGDQLNTCSDFNYAASKATEAGLSNVYTCPDDGISGKICNVPFSTRNVSEIVQSNLQWDDVVFYFLIGPNSKTHPLKWWIRLIDAPVDMVMIGDNCSISDIPCNKAFLNHRDELISHQPLLRLHALQALKGDSGYNVLSCKLRTGIRKVYELFPSKKYYFKIDTDTLLFPKRFFNFLNTLHSVALSETNGLYFGTVTESGGNQLLCWDSSHHLLRDEWKKENGGICYGQGGAGYGLNNIAMKMFANHTHTCNQGNLEKMPEDTFTAIRMLDEFDSLIIHCGGFRSSEIVSEKLFKHSITFHYIDANWLKKYGENLENHYNYPDKYDNVKF